MRKLIFISIAIFLLIGINYLNSNIFRNTSLAIVKKPSYFITEKLFDFKILLISLFDYSFIMQENYRLSEENYKLISKIAEIDSIQKEYLQLKKQLSLSSLKPYKLEPVRIFLFNYDLNGASAFIDKGEDSGLTKGQAVIYGGNILIGVIKEVFSKNSQISLIVDPEIQINSKLSHDTFALTRGAMINGLLLDFAEIKDQIKEGDLVFTSGLDGFPENLLIGKVNKIEISSGNLFKKVFINPLFLEINSTHAFVINN